MWEEAKTFLINQEPLRPLDHHEGLSKAAADHARDIVKTNSSGHQGSDGSTFISEGMIGLVDSEEGQLVIYSVHDVTELRRTQADLHQTHPRLVSKPTVIKPYSLAEK